MTDTALSSPSEPFRPVRGTQSGRLGRPARVFIATFLFIYTFVTLVPFYFLFVRSFVPTKDSTRLYLWIPQPEEISMDSQFGNLATFYKIDISHFKREMGITGYINSSLTLKEVATDFNLPEDKVKAYYQSYITYNGIYSIFAAGKFFNHIFGTVFVAVVSIVVGGFLGLATGSALAGFRKRWHLWVYYLYLLQISIAPIMIILPTYLIMTRVLNLYDSYLALILLYIKGGALSTMVFTTYAASIPKDLRESVEIDGGSFPTYFFRVLLPLARTPFAVYASISLPVIWNDLLYGFLFLSPEKFTVIPMVTQYTGTFATNLQATYSGLLFATLPLLAVYLVFQRLFMRAALAGAVKG